jgi:hypothetical protein
MPSHSTLRPSASVANVAAASAEAHVRLVGEGRLEQLADGLAFHSHPASVVLEHHVIGVHRHDRIDVLVVPSLVVAIDEGREVHARILRPRGNLRFARAGLG